MSTFADLKTEDIRLAILEVLESDTDYSQNEYIIQSALDYVGHAISQTRLHAELDWLSEAQLITQAQRGDIRVVKLTPRGEDVVLCRVRVEGVRRKVRQ